MEHHLYFLFVFGELAKKAAVLAGVNISILTAVRV